MQDPLTDVQKGVLKALERDARQTPEQLAAGAGCSVDAAETIIAAAEADGLVTSWGARVNWDKAGEPRIFALIEVTVDPQDNTGYNQVARRIARFDEVRTVYFVSGDYDLMVMVQGREMGDIAEFVSEKLAPMPAVRHTTTHMLMKRFKEAGVLLDVEEASGRQKVSF